MLARQNPFNSSNMKKVSYRWTDTTSTKLLSRLMENHFCGCILGQHGSGKTALLQMLRTILERRGQRTCLIFINRQTQLPLFALLNKIKQAARSEAFILIDGADLLRAHQWYLIRFFSQHASGLIVTSHDRILLPVLHRCVPSIDLLSQIVCELTGSASVNLPLNEMYLKQHANMREVLRELYDRYSMI